MVVWYHHMQNDELRWTTKQRHLLATIHLWHLSLFDHNAQTPDETDA